MLPRPALPNQAEAERKAAKPVTEDPNAAAAGRKADNLNWRARRPVTDAPAEAKPDAAKENAAKENANKEEPKKIEDKAAASRFLDEQEHSVLKPKADAKTDGAEKS